jgi:hypothetical protein
MMRFTRFCNRINALSMRVQSLENTEVCTDRIEEANVPDKSERLMDTAKSLAEKLQLSGEGSSLVRHKPFHSEPRSEGACKAEKSDFINVSLKVPADKTAPAALAGKSRTLKESTRILGPAKRKSRKVRTTLVPL